MQDQVHAGRLCSVCVDPWSPCPSRGLASRDWQCVKQVALGMMRRSVRKRAGFDLDEVAPLDVVGRCFVPALFGVRLLGA